MDGQAQSKGAHINYHHYSLRFDSNEVCERFTDVRFVLVAGSALRAEAQAKYLAEIPSLNSNFEELTKPTSRFMLYKVGPVLVGNHGMGSPSMSIALHEIFLMCREAKVLELITLIRFGTCGGIGVQQGTLCITNRALDPLMQDFIELKVCKKVVRRPCIIDIGTANELERLARELSSDGQLFDVKMGATIASNDFYEEQGRTSGAICDHSEEDKMKFLHEASRAGVINIEMESNVLAAMCHKLGVRFGVACVALNNRLIGDHHILKSDELSQFEHRLFKLNSAFIEHKLSINRGPI